MLQNIWIAFYGSNWITYLIIVFSTPTLVPLKCQSEPVTNIIMSNTNFHHPSTDERHWGNTSFAQLDFIPDQLL